MILDKKGKRIYSRVATLITFCEDTYLGHLGFLAFSGVHCKSQTKSNHIKNILKVSDPIKFNSARDVRKQDEAVHHEINIAHRSLQINLPDELSEHVTRGICPHSLIPRG